MITIVCAYCDTEYGKFDKKKVPKSFVCLKCNTGQHTTYKQWTAFTKHRNYPEGFFE